MDSHPAAQSAAHASVRRRSCTSASTLSFVRPSSASRAAWASLQRALARGRVVGGAIVVLVAAAVAALGSPALAAAERSAERRAAESASQAPQPDVARPVLRVMDDTLRWARLADAPSYVLATTVQPHVKHRTTFRVVRGTTFRPARLAGKKVAYSLRASLPGAPWSRMVSITWPRISASGRHGVSSDSSPVLTLRGHTISWAAQPGATGFAGAISTAARGAANRTTTYRTLGNVTSWTPQSACRQTLYYGVASQGPAGDQWTSDEVSIAWPTCSSHTTRAGTGAGTGTGGATGPVAVGVNETGWGVPGAQDVGSAFGWDRLDTTVGEAPSDFFDNGVKVDVLIPGCNNACGDGSGVGYSGNGVSEINPTTWAANALSYYQSNCNASTADCPAIEVLNEPGGDWFWGGNADSQTNASAYAVLLQDTWTAFHNQYGANSPKILASYDGGEAGSVAWGQAVWAANPSVGNYVDGVTVHPYGGTGDASQSALGNRGDITAANQQTNKPVWVTEVGWPTAVGQPATGDSLQWTEQQQADNIYNFVTWAKSTGHVAGIMYFGYRDYSTNDWYGLERWNQGGSTVNGSKKPGWYALQQAANGQSCTVC